MLQELGLVEIKKTSSTKVGDVFDRLTVLAVGSKLSGKKKKTYAVCSCSCGETNLVIRLDSVTKGITRSCGCYHEEQNQTHGLTNHHYYKRWAHMLDRCNNPENPAYKYYGGRGIKVCDRWYDVRNYVADLPDGYKSGLEIDRIDNNGNYEPGNVRWATSKENGRNKRNNVLLTYNGQTKTITEWSEITGIHHTTIKDRIDKQGMTVEQALTLPLVSDSERAKKTCAKRWEGHVKKVHVSKTDRKIRKFLYDGEELTTKQLSDKTGISAKLLSKRLCEYNWPIEKAVLSKEQIKHFNTTGASKQCQPLK